MDLSVLKTIIDYGGMFVIAIGAFFWIVRVDIPKRERRFERQHESMLKAFASERSEMLNAFKDDRIAILDKLECINVTLVQSGKMGMVQFLMDRDPKLTFETALMQVQRHWE